MLGSDLTSMKLKRTAKLAVLGAAVAAWLAAAVTSGGRGAPSITIKKPLVDSNSAALASEIARLHDRLRPATTPRQPARNLFSYGTSKAQSSVAPPAAARPALSEAIPVSPAPAPLKLSGIAEDEIPDGVVRTAIISGLGQLFLVKEGESFADRYRVLRISSDVVELTDLVDGDVLRLALR
jgi:hypothetical protein